jgi:hypothetical protein
MKRTARSEKTSPQSETEAAVQLFENWFDPIEAGLRDRRREFLQSMLEAELDEVLERSPNAGIIYKNQS